MAIKASRIDVWMTIIDDRAGGAAEKLEALAKAGADLEVVFARRTPEQPGQGILFAGPIAGLIGRRIGSKWPLAAGMALVAAAAGSLAAWHDEPWEILAAMPVLGVGVGFAFAAMATLITEAVRPTETGVATGMNTVMRTVGGVIGGQMGAALLAAHKIPGTNAPSVVGFEIAFAVSAVAALVGAGVAVLVTPPRLRKRERLQTAEVSPTS